METGVWWARPRKKPGKEKKRESHRKKKEKERNPEAAGEAEREKERGELGCLQSTCGRMRSLCANLGFPKDGGGRPCQGC